MVTLMQRRREMMKMAASPTPPTPEWDVSWDGSDGIVPSEAGFTKEIIGTGSETLLTQSVNVKATGTSSYVKYIYDTTNQIGVFEVDCRIATNNSIIYIGYSDGTNSIAVRMQYSSNYKGIYLRDATSIGDSTKLKTIALSTRYKIKLILYGSTADVYCDDVALATGVDTSTIHGLPDGTVAEFTRSSSGEGSGNFYTMKLKLGRT